jgi:hypothetical protein
LRNSHLEQLTGASSAVIFDGVDFENAGRGLMTWPHSLYFKTNRHRGQVRVLSGANHCSRQDLPNIWPHAVMTGSSTLPSTFGEWYGWMQIKQVIRGLERCGWRHLMSAPVVSIEPCSKSPCSWVYVSSPCDIVDENVGRCIEIPGINPGGTRSRRLLRWTVKVAEYIKCDGGIVFQIAMRPKLELCTVARNILFHSRCSRK